MLSSGCDSNSRWSGFGSPQRRTSPMTIGRMIEYISRSPQSGSHSVLSDGSPRMCFGMKW